MKENGLELREGARVVLPNTACSALLSCMGSIFVLNKACPVWPTEPEFGYVRSEFSGPSCLALSRKRKSGVDNVRDHP